MTNETNEIIFGKNSVMEALIAGDREINKILPYAEFNHQGIISQISPIK